MSHHLDSPLSRQDVRLNITDFNPNDSERASTYNTTRPADDAANYGELFAQLVANVVTAYGTSDDAATYGADRLNVRITRRAGDPGAS